MTDDDKGMNPLHFRSDPAHTRMRINGGFKSGITFNVAPGADRGTCCQSALQLSPQGNGRQIKFAVCVSTLDTSTPCVQISTAPQSAEQIWLNYAPGWRSVANTHVDSDCPRDPSTRVKKYSFLRSTILCGSHYFVFISSITAVLMQLRCYQGNEYEIMAVREKNCRPKKTVFLTPVVGSLGQSLSKCETQVDLVIFNFCLQQWKNY